MGISISNVTNSAITKYSASLRSGEPDWSMIPSAGKSNKSQAEFVAEIKELPDYLEEKPSFDRKA